MSFRKRENRRMSDSSMAQRVGYRRTHNLVTAELRKVKARRIADVGCGTGVLTAHLARELKPDLIVGTELSPSLLALATRRGALSRTLTNGGIVFPTRRRLAQMVREAGFEVIEQRSIRRHAVGLPTSLATIGRRPEPAKEKR